MQRHAQEQDVYLQLNARCLLSNIIPKRIWLFLTPAAFRAPAILCSALQTSGHIPCVCTLATLHQACVGCSASAREAVEPQNGMYTPSDTTAVPSVPPSTPAVGDNSPLTSRRSLPSPCRPQLWHHCSLSIPHRRQLGCRGGPPSCWRLRPCSGRCWGCPCRAPGTRG